MTFFYDLNKKLDSIREKPETTHQQLNERDMSRAAKGYEKYGKQGMEALAKAGREGKALDPVRAKYGKYNEGAAESHGDTQIRPGMRVSQGTVVKVDGNTVVVKTSNGDLMTMNIHDIDQGVAEGLSEMDKSQTPPGRDGGTDLTKKQIHLGPEHVIKAKDVVKHTLKALDKSMKKSHADTPKKKGVAEGLGLYGPFTVTISTGERPQSRTKTKKFRREDDAILWAQDWLEDFPQYSFATAEVTDPEGNVVWTTDEQGVAEGPEVFKLKADAAKKAGEKEFKGPDGKMYPVKEGKRPDYPDLDNDGNKKESISQAAKDAEEKKKKHQAVEEGWDDMIKDVERRQSGMKSGEKIQGHKGEIEKTDTGIRHTRRYDPKTGETGDDDAPKGERRSPGRPKKTDKAPERVTSKAYKHKGTRKMSNEDIQEAIAALEEAGYSVEERKLSSSEKEEREDIVKGMKKNKAGFAKRYGDRGEEVMYATATKLAKERGPGNPDRKKKETSEEVDETTVAGSVAPSAAVSKSKSKGGMTFGKGIYDSLNRELEGMISESMNVSVNMHMDDTGQPHKNITVRAEGEAAEQLAQLLNLAGMAAHSSGYSEVNFDYDKMVDENAPDWPTSPEYTSMKQSTDPVSNDLNKNKDTGQTTGAPFNSQPQRQGVMGENKDLGLNLYQEYKKYKAK